MRVTISIMLSICFAGLLGGCAPLPHKQEVKAQSIPFLVGQQYFLNGDYEDAAICFRNQATSNPASPEVAQLYYWIGTCRLNQHRYLEARQAYQQCLKKNPPKKVEIAAWSGIGDCYRMEYRFADAAEVYERVLNTGSPEIERDAIAFSRAVCLLRDGQTAAANQAFTEFVRDYPDSQWVAQAREKAAMAGTFCVQAGAFDNRAPARDMAASLERKGFQARIEKSLGNYCVRVGREKSWDEVLRLANRIRAAGFSVLCLP